MTTSTAHPTGPPPPAATATTPTTASHPQPTNPSHPQSNPASPPSRRDLKSWWKRFQTQTTGKQPETHEPRPPHGIFGVPLEKSITYANVAISLIDEDGKSYIYGYVPIIVAKCGVFLKEKATSIEGIFRLSGSEKRIKELKLQFDSPDRWGRGLAWDGYTVHDAANVLRRYLNDLPEPVVPLEMYEPFRDPLRGHTIPAVGDTEGTQLTNDFNESEAIVKYQQLIKNLPPVNRQLLLYILDLLAVFAAKADENRMTAQNLAAIFQPGMLSHPAHAMAPEEYRLNQCVIIFLIENQDHFLIGMQGTATDENTRRAIEQGPPAIVTPTTPSRATGVHRSASNGSATAESTKESKIRRNRSTSSRHSRQSNGASTPNSPHLMATPTGGLGRSNTVPSKKSPNMSGGRFARQEGSVAAGPPGTPSPSGTTNVAPPPTVTEESTTGSNVGGPVQSPPSSRPKKSSEKLLDPNTDMTPSKERNLPSLFQRSPGSDNDRRQPNKLRKKRISSANPSAQSSTTSLHHHGGASPPLDSPPIMESRAFLEPYAPDTGAPADTPSEPTPRASQVPSTNTVPQTDTDSKTLKPQESPDASEMSYNDASDMEQLAEDNALTTSNTENSEKDKKRRWRISRRHEPPSVSSTHNLGTNSTADMSTTTFGSSNKPRKSWTGNSAEVAAALAEGETGGKDKDEGKNPISWIKNKYREAKEEHKRAKSPPENTHTGFSGRGKSFDIRRDTEETTAPVPDMPKEAIPKQAMVKETSTQEAPREVSTEAPVKEAPIKEAPPQEAPVKGASTAEVSTKAAPTNKVAIEEAQQKEAPAPAVTAPAVTSADPQPTQTMNQPVQDNSKLPPTDAQPTMISQPVRPETHAVKNEAEISAPVTLDNHSAAHEDNKAAVVTKPSPETVEQTSMPTIAEQTVQEEKAKAT